MSIKSETSNANARVTFKDYAFFVPKDSKGMTGKMSGVIKVKLLSEGEIWARSYDSPARGIWSIH